MNEIVYSLENVMSRHEDKSVLGKTNTQVFYIPPYQRGYKWASTGSNSAVQLFMSDLMNAHSSDSEEYFLQYITLSINKNCGDKELKGLEVIDGQQRLTTISVLFAVLAHSLDDFEYDGKNLLLYGVRESVQNFIADFLNDKLAVILNEESWESFLEHEKVDKEKYDEQDIFYLFQAARAINKRLSESKDKNSFAEFCKKRVKLIVNIVEDGEECERVFSNLNTNKKDLTNAELVKGLILTNAARKKETGRGNLYFREILEKRATIGRQWSEIERWCQQPDIKAFYFKGSKEPMEDLLSFWIKAKSYEDKEEGEKKDSNYDIFNTVLKQIRTDKKKDAFALFKELKEIRSILNDFFNKPALYNKLGYLFHYKGSRFNLLNKDFISAFKIYLCPEVDDKQNEELDFESFLDERIVGILGDWNDKDFIDLNYKEDGDVIHRILLALSIFRIKLKFNFREFNKVNKWTLEHIFPQNPKDISNELKKQDISLLETVIGGKVNELLSDDVSDENPSILFQIKAIFSKETVILNEDVKNKIGALLKSSIIDNIGNMALLSGSDNSSNSNGMYNAKRINIVNRISKGSFVPKHTYDVFSKLVFNQDTDYSSDVRVWTDKDIVSHAVSMEKIIKDIMNEFTPKK